MRSAGPKSCASKQEVTLLKKLSKNDLAAREDLVKRLNEAFSALNNSIDEFNSALQARWAEVEDAQNVYNAVIGDAQAWRDEIVGQIDDYIGERSEKWHEGDKAEAYETFKGEYEGLDLTESDMSAPDELSIEIDNAAESLEQLPDAVEE